MSQENVELVRQTVEPTNRRDFDAIDDLATADYEWHNAPDFPGGGIHRGREAVKAYLRDYLDTWETYTLEEEPVIDAASKWCSCVASTRRQRRRREARHADRLRAYLP